jgi:iron complex outermembrane receptor protein
MLSLMTRIAAQRRLRSAHSRVRCACLVSAGLSLCLHSPLAAQEPPAEAAPVEGATPEVAPSDVLTPEATPPLDAPPVCALLISGAVGDADGRPIKDVQLLIVFINAEGEEDFYEVHVSEDGSYRSPALCAGVYWLEASALGFKQRREQLTLAANITHRLTLVRERAARPPKDGGAATKTRAQSHDLGAQIGDALDERDLDRKRGVPLGEALKGVGGVRAIETGTVSKPMLHGIHSQRLPIIVDDFRHEAQSWGLDHSPEVDPFSAQRIVVLKGSAGVRYGADGVGGALVVEPPPLPREPGIDGALYAVGATNGRQGTLGLALRGGIPGATGWGWRVQGNAKKAGALQTPEYVLDNTGAEELNGSASVGYRDTTRGLRLTFGRFNNNLGVFTGLVSDNANQFNEQIALDKPRGVERYRFDYELERPRQEVDHTTIAAHSFLSTALGRLSLNAAYQHNARKEYDLVRSNIKGPQLDFDLRTFDNELLLDISGASWISSFGATFKYQENRFQGRRLIPNYRTYAGSAFGMFHYLFEEAELEVGARADLISTETFQREAVGGDNAPIETNELSFFTPSVVAGAHWEATDKLDFKLGAALTTRAPSINELFIDGVSQGLAAFERGDLQLDSERGYAATLDASWTRDLFQLRATGYAKLIHDYIYLAPELDAQGEVQVRLTSNGGFPSFVYRNIDAQLLGFDGQLTLTPLKWLALDLKASVIRAQEVGTGQRLVYIPPDYYEQTLTLKRGKIGPLRAPYIAASHAYTAEQTRVELRADFAPPPSGYSLLGASAGATLYEDEDGASLGLDIELKNALDTRYRSYLSRLRYFSDEPGRDLVLRLKGTF